MGFEFRALGCFSLRAQGVGSTGEGCQPTRGCGRVWGIDPYEFGVKVQGSGFCCMVVFCSPGHTYSHSPEICLGPRVPESESNALCGCLFFFSERDSSSEKRHC